jgi:hypothetical protein
MKIQIWIPIKDAVKSKLDPNNYSVSDPDSSKWVQVLVTPDELARLEDSTESWSDDGWLVEQYNRNKAPEDHVKTTEEIPHVYEKNPDTGQVFRRRIGDYDTPREEIVPAKKSRRRGSERIATIDDMTTFVRTLNGGEFQQWWERAGEADKKLYAMAFEELQKLDPREARVQND